MPGLVAIDDATSESVHRVTEESRFVWPPLILAIVMLWLVPMGMSLGLDESGNHWVIQAGLRESLVRSDIWVSSWISNALMIAARNLGGDSEIVVRFPSLLTMVAATWLLYLLGKRVIGRLAAAYACLVFVCLRDVVYIATTERPYPVALLSVIAAVLCLVYWMDTGRVRFGVGYAVACAATVYSQYLFGPTILVHVVYFIWRQRSSESMRIGVRSLLIAWSAAGLLLIPLVPHILHLAERRNQSVYTGAPGMLDLIISLAPPVTIGSIVVGVLFCFLRGQQPLDRFTGPSQNITLLLAMVLTHPGILFLLSLFTDTHVFVERYYLGSAPGLALAFGAYIASFPAPGIRKTIAASIAICAVLVMGIGEWFARGLDDWRGASEAVQQKVHDSDTPVLFVSGFFESTVAGAVENPALKDVLFAPIMRYPIPGKLVRLPMLMKDDVRLQLETFVRTELADRDEFLLYGMDRYPTKEYRAWLEGRTAPLGFQAKPLGGFRGLQVTVFTRSK